MSVYVLRTVFGSVSAFAGSTKTAAVSAAVAAIAASRPVSRIVAIVIVLSSSIVLSRSHRAMKQQGWSAQSTTGFVASQSGDHEHGGQSRAVEAAGSRTPCASTACETT